MFLLSLIQSMCIRKKILDDNFFHNFWGAKKLIFYNIFYGTPGTPQVRPDRVPTVDIFFWLLVIKTLQDNTVQYNYSSFTRQSTISYSTILR